MILWHAWDSVSSIKVRIALAERRLDFESRIVNLLRFEQAQPDYLKINPKGVVPSLEHEGAIHVESNDIIGCINQAFPGAPLRPADPPDQARLEAWLEHEATGVFPAIRTITLELSMKQVFNGYSEEELNAMLAHHPRPKLVPVIKKVLQTPPDNNAANDAGAKMRAVFEHMEDELADGPWLAGRSYTLADIALAPHVFRLGWLGLAHLWSGLPQTTDWIGRIENLPEYRKAIPPEDKRLPQPNS